ncbi:MAG: hypothetical protein U1F59_10570 [Candidatus Competibacteraceae bacterium]
MMTSQMLATSNEREVDGSLCLIPVIPDPQAKPLLNAENLTLTEEGRLFVTGSLAAYEIVWDEDGTFRQQAIPITAGDVPGNCLMNGITARGNSLYLACTHIHKGKNSLLPNLFGDIRNIDQNSGFLLLVLAETVYQVDSYIVRADLDQESPVFTEGIRLPGKCFANGLDSDEQGSLYAANSVVGLSPSLFKIRFPEACGTITLGTVWHRPIEHGTPNGLKIKGDYVYYTCLHGLPVWASTLQRVRIMPDGSAGEAEIVYKSLFSIFDDFDIVDDGFVIANIFSIPYRFGCLLFVTNSGELRGIFRSKNHKSPSAVKVVRKTNNPFKEGDILITEKGRHCVSWFKPDEQWRQWLVGYSAHH